LQEAALTLGHTRVNSTVRLLSHRARGFRCVDTLIALIHLVCGDLKVERPA
jgi:hypothetical protein